MNFKSGHLFVLIAFMAAAGCKKENKATSTTVPLSTSRTASANGIAGFPVNQITDRAIAFDYTGNGKQDHILLYRAGGNMVTICHNINPPDFPAYYADISSTTGIGGYTLTVAPPAPQYNYNEIGGDHIVPFDYDSDGKNDDLICYRPGTKLIWILRNNHNGTFTPVFQSTVGIGGFNLDQGQDKIFGFDYDGSGKADHLLLYRAGGAAVWILKNTNGVFTPVFQSGSGIGGYNMDNGNDQIVPFDYYSNGKLDHLVCYRPGSGALWIIEKGANGAFTPVYKTSTGVPGFPINQITDRVFALDYLQDGHRDHLLFYSPGVGTVSVVTRSTTTGLKQQTGPDFSAELQFWTAPTAQNGYLGDRAFALDNNSTGIMSNIVHYVPGTYSISVYNNVNFGYFEGVF